MTARATPAVSFRDVTKVYPPAVRAVDRVSLDVMSGEIHAFVGENGAGKSTLMKILSGEVRPDAGSVALAGRQVSYRSAGDAMADGIGMVHQELLLVNELSVWENVVLGVEPVRHGLIDRAAARSSVAETFRDAGLSLNLDAIVGDLSVGANQKVEIAKLLHRSTHVLILDEPTAVLTPQEVPELFEELRRLRDAGRTICFISHHLDEVMNLADRITVLRDGAWVTTVRTEETSAPALARLMVERDVVLTSQRRAQEMGEPVLVLRALRIGASSGSVSLTVHAGEIVGVAGVEGNGQQELVGAIVGSHPSAANECSVRGVDLRTLGLLDRRRHLAYVPAERKTEGGALDASLVENVAMTHHRLSPGFFQLRGWLLNRSVARELAESIRREYGVVASSVDQPLGSLSGGNQQKVILGRELAGSRPLMVLDQPTRGVDVGSIEDIHRRILAIRAQNRAVLVVSADLDELLRLCDRIVVLHRGSVVLDGPVEAMTYRRLGHAMLQGIDVGIDVAADPGMDVEPER